MVHSEEARTRIGADQHPDIVKQLSARAEAWVTALPKEYNKTADKQD